MRHLSSFTDEGLPMQRRSEYDGSRKRPRLLSGLGGGTSRLLQTTPRAFTTSSVSLLSTKAVDLAKPLTFGSPLQVATKPSAWIYEGRGGRTKSLKDVGRGVSVSQLEDVLVRVDLQRLF